jgi:DNA polymerase-1
MQTKAGEQSNATFGVVSMLLSILTKEQPDALLFCFDEGEETFRHQESATYKEGRAETPDDFYTQIPRILQGIDAFGIHRVSDARFEADDFLCAYACEATKDPAMRVTIVTGDRDALQIATDRIRIAIPHKGYQAAEYLGPSEILAKYGIRPDQVPSYKGLTGDSSDNLPGVKGIGPKNAAALLQQYGTLTGIYAHLTDIKPSVRAKLEADRESAFFCEKMATLVCDISLPVSLDRLLLRDIPTDAVVAFLRSMDFTLLERRFRTLLTSQYGRSICTPSSIAVPAAKGEGQMAMF